MFGGSISALRVGHLYVGVRASIFIYNLPLVSKYRISKSSLSLRKEILSFEHRLSVCRCACFDFYIRSAAMSQAESPISTKEISTKTEYSTLSIRGRPCAGVLASIFISNLLLVPQA